MFYHIKFGKLPVVQIAIIVLLLGSKIIPKKVSPLYQKSQLLFSNLSRRFAIFVNLQMEIHELGLPVHGGPAVINWWKTCHESLKGTEYVNVSCFFHDFVFTEDRVVHCRTMVSSRPVQRAVNIPRCCFGPLAASRHRTINTDTYMLHVFVRLLSPGGRHF